MDDSIQKTVGSLIFGEQGQGGLAAIPVDDGNLVGVGAKAGLAAHDIIDHHQIKVLFDQFTMPLLEMVVAFCRKPDEEWSGVMAFFLPKFQQDVWVGGKAETA